MSSAQFFDLMSTGGVFPPAQEDLPGYLVECAEGISNHVDFKGRVTWVPKEDFQFRHQAIEGMEDLPDFLVRMQAEIVQLNQRLSDLVKFTKSDGFFKLIQVQRELLLEQCRVMTSYSTILDKRMSLHLMQIEHKRKAIAALK